MNGSVTATLWIKGEDGKWNGCFVANGGELGSIAPVLLSSYSTASKVKSLIALRGIEKLEQSPSDCKKVDTDIFTPCGESMMSLQAKEDCHYCYVFDDGMWYYGPTKKHPLEEIIRFITRS